MTHPKDETPTADQASGVSGQQLSFLPTPAFSPILPPRGSAAEQALLDLATQPGLTQIDWLKTGKGWRLAAAVKQLDYLGWCPDSVRVQAAGWGRKIALYTLPPKAKQAAARLMGGRV